jgi:NADP-dependent 3-hydroxy acid dehydrogenase YdfG
LAAFTPENYFKGGWLQGVKEFQEKLPPELRTRIRVAKIGERSDGEDLVSQFGQQQVLDAIIQSGENANTRKIKRTMAYAEQHPEHFAPEDLYRRFRYPREVT